MATIDWVIIILLALGAVSGFMKGFFKQLAAVVGLIAGLLVARALFAGLGEHRQFRHHRLSLFRIL